MLLDWSDVGGDENFKDALMVTTFFQSEGSQRAKVWYMLKAAKKDDTESKVGRLRASVTK